MANTSTAPPAPSAEQHSIPTYQSLSTVNVANFVTFRLSGNHMSSNYSTWRLQMLSLFESHDLLGYIEGRVRPPPQPTSVGVEGYDVWRTDKVAKGWILGTLAEPEVVAMVANLGTAREVWSELVKIFNEARAPFPGQSESQPEHGPAITPRPPGEDEQAIIPKDFFNVQIPLLKAGLKGDWGTAQEILDHDPGAAKTWIDNDKVLTPLEVAVGTGKAIHFVENLVALIPEDESVAIQNDKGSTGLHIAAAVGNRAAAIILVHRMPRLCYIPDSYGDYPIQYAAQYAQKGVLQYLITVTKANTVPNPYAGLPGLRLLAYTIDAEFFDIAMYLVENYPYLSGLRFSDGNSALAQLVASSVLLNKRHFNLWERFISSRIPLATKFGSHSTFISEGMSGPDNTAHPDDTIKPQVFQSLHAMFWKLLEYIVPQIKVIKKKTLANKQALELVKFLCKTIRSLGNFDESRSIYEDAVLIASELGVREVVEVIMDVFPLAIYAYRLPSRQYIFHEAVENRSEDVFNLIYQMSDHRHLFSNIVDGEDNNLLHLAGKIAPSHKLNEISGAALQMQREIQWFKEVESFVHPSSRERRNYAGKTPQMVFSEEHKTLKEVGERWMKDTANSCTIAAALIATVMFSGAITVPGGNDGAGYPNFSKEPAFIIFAISDAVSLFASITSLLMFLSILTSRYAEQDFLYVLPKRLIYGLSSLFLSISSMMVSFSVTLYLVFGKKNDWVLAAVLLLALLPITSFVMLQFPLLVDLVIVTYGPGIFGKKSNRPFY